jgi:hypothetical protein
MNLELAGALLVFLLLILVLAPDQRPVEPPRPSLMVMPGPLPEEGASNVPLLLATMFLVAVLVMLVNG